MMYARRAMAVAAAVAMSFAFAGTAVAAPDTAPPTTPTNLRVTASTDTTVTLAWNPSTDNSGSFYYFLRDNVGTVVYPPQTRTSWQFTGLLPQRTYVYTIQAFDFARNGSGTSTVSHTTPPDVTPPSAPTLTVNYVAPARVSAWWTVSTDNASMIVFQTLLVNGAPRTGDMIRSRTQILLDLTPSTVYSLVVRATDPSGNASLSNTVSVTTPAITDTVPPTVPTNLRGHDDGGCEAVLGWDRSTDNAEPQMTILYRFYVNGVLAPPSSMVLGGGSTGGASVVRGTQPGVNVFTVEAVDGSGNASGPSAPLSLAISGC